MRKRKFEKNLALTMAFVVSFSSIYVYSKRVKAENTNKTENTQQYVIKLDTASTYEMILEKYPTAVIDDNITDSLKEENIIVADMTNNEAERLANEKGVISFEKDIIVTGSNYIGINDEDRNNIEWNLDVINANNNEYDSGNDPVKVAIIDSGVVATADIDVIKRINLIPGEENVEILFDDISGHGTAIASIIAGKDNGDGVTGVNPNALIYSVKVLDEENKASVSRVAEGIYKCIDEDVDIINMSFGTIGNSEILHQAVQAANDAGILMIAAAGNRGEHDKLVEYPAAYSEVLAVGATDTNAEISDISSTGDKVDIVAPGENVAVLGIWDEVNLMDGTSLSAAEVTGVASVLLSLDNSKSPEFIRGLINNASNYSIGTGNVGLVDLSYAISIYDEFNEKFSEQEINSIENTRSVKTYDVNEVNASFKTSYHESILDSYSQLSDSAKKVIKKGLVYPDKFKFNFDRVQALHGFRNYIGDYIYLAKLARNTYTDGLSKALSNTAHPLGTSNTNGNDSVTDIKNYIAALNSAPLKTNPTADNEGNWLDILGYNPSSVTAERLRNDQGRFIIGMAIHAAMDAYSHRGRVSGIAYDGGQADEKTLTGSNYTKAQIEAFNLRWTVAKTVTTGIINQWQGDHNFSILQFHKDVHKENTFTMQHFLSYTKNSDGSNWSGRSSSVKTFFEIRTE